MRLDNTRMTTDILNGTGVDPAGQMFKKCTEESTTCHQHKNDEENDKITYEESMNIEKTTETAWPKRKRRFVKSF